MEEANDSSAIDRISDLPDLLIHQILSLLPSTKDSIRTSILSKRWKNQWSHVPVLVFESSGECDADFARFIDSTLLLYECSKMKKFYIHYDFGEDTNTNLNEKLRFAMRKDVEVLFLSSSYSYIVDQPKDKYRLPKFIFDNASLVELQIFNCDFELSSRINWPSLKELTIERCGLGDRLSIENVLSGCPSLESLDVDDCYFEIVVIIASKSLKILILIDLQVDDYIEICCPNLEELILKYFNIQKCKLVNLPSSCCATLNFYIPSPLEEGSAKTLARKILNDLQGVKEVTTIGNWFVEILSDIEMRQPYYPLLNIKCLTLNHPDFYEHIVGVVNALGCSPALERLVIKLGIYQGVTSPLDSKLNKYIRDYLDSNVTGFPCLVSHLKTVKIIGLSNGDNRCKFVLLFIEFLLMNAKALQKMVVILSKYGGGPGTDFLHQVSRKLLSFPRASQHAIVELL